MSGATKSDTEEILDDGRDGYEGGARGTHIVGVEVREVRTGPKARAIRLRVTMERQVIQGTYLTTSGHRARGSITLRPVQVRYDATITAPAVARFRHRVRTRARRWGLRSLRTYAIRAAAEELTSHRAPVCRYTVAALLATVDLTTTPRYVRMVLSQGGWRRLRWYEYPRHAIHHGISCWIRD